MKATELTIGDWVSLSEIPNEIRQCFVVGLDEDELRVCQPQDKDCDIIGYDMITPIPLTAEILERNPKVYYLCSLHLSTEECDVNGFVLKVRANCIMGINYAHQLQHALRLCGLNELADNLKI